MILQESYRLENGVQIPRLGLGTWFIADDKAARAVRDAVEVRISSDRYGSGLRQ